MKNKKELNFRLASGLQTQQVVGFDVGVFLKSGKEFRLKEVRAIEVNAQAGLIVISDGDGVKVYPISNIEYYEFVEKKEAVCHDI